MRARLWCSVIWIATANEPVFAGDAGLSPQQQYELQFARETLAEVKGLVARNLDKDPAKPDDGDLQGKCAALDNSGRSLGGRPEKEIRDLFSEASRVCSYDAMLIVLRETLNVAEREQTKGRRLLCNVEQPDLDKLRLAKPADAKVMALVKRWRRVCNK